MWYEINVAKWTRQADGKERYVHLFATDERSLKTEAKAKDLYHLLCLKFPEPEYHVSVIRWNSNGQEIKHW